VERAEVTSMSTIRGTIQDGQVVLPTPADLPNGTPVRVVSEADEYVGIGMREEDWPTTPEGIEALAAKMDQIQPFLTPEEEAEWQEARAEYKAWQLANLEARCKKIEDLFR
jgi:hypothetical protein